MSEGLLRPVAVDPANPRVTFSLIDSDFHLTSQAIQHAGLTPEESRIVQTRVDSMKASMTAAIKERLEVDELRTQPDEGVHAFRIPAFPSEGRSVRQSFETTLELDVGREKALLLLQSFNWSALFGAFGELETLAQVREIEHELGNFVQVEWEQRNPETGKWVSRSSATIEDFIEEYGDIIDIPE